jgi:capsular polysaccharide biosynthesis protein
VTTPAPPGRGFDPEAEQEVDFARYGRMLASRWWLLAAGVVAGAVIGYLVSLGGTQVYQATATLYLGQPYSGVSSSVAIQNPQTNPSAVGTVVHAQSVDDKIASRCNTAVSVFRKGISTQAIATGASTKGNAATVNPLVQITVQTKKGKVATCAANQLALEVARELGTYATRKIDLFKAHLAFDNKDIAAIQTAIANPTISDTDKLLLQTTLRGDQLDKTTNSQLLLQAKQIEAPRLLTPAAAHQTTARSRRNTVVIAALIGLILGILAALLWDRVVPRLTARNGD